MQTIIVLGGFLLLFVVAAIVIEDQFGVSIIPGGLLGLILRPFRPQSERDLDEAIKASKNRASDVTRSLEDKIAAILAKTPWEQPTPAYPHIRVARPQDPEDFEQSEAVFDLGLQKLMAEEGVRPYNEAIGVWEPYAKQGNWGVQMLLLKHYITVE